MLKKSFKDCDYVDTISLTLSLSTLNFGTGVTSILTQMPVLRSGGHYQYVEITNITYNEIATNTFVGPLVVKAPFAWTSDNTIIIVSYAGLNSTATAQPVNQIIDTRVLCPVDPSFGGGYSFQFVSPNAANTVFPNGSFLSFIINFYK